MSTNQSIGEITKQLQAELAEVGRTLNETMERACNELDAAEGDRAAETQANEAALESFRDCALRVSQVRKTAYQLEVLDVLADAVGMIAIIDDLASCMDGQVAGWLEEYVAEYGKTA